MISIIVPVYNASNYLAQCIESIISQTYQNWELILVDDGSKDQSGKICDEYALQEKRIRVIHKKNGGVSSARNAGLKLAKGEFICFIDSDDWVDSSYLEDFKTNQVNADFYFSGALYDTYGQVYSYSKYNKQYCKDIEQISECFFAQNLFSNGYPWGKLFKNQVISNHNLRFNENLSINEDHIFVFQYFQMIKSLYVTNTAGYHYTVFDHSGRKLSGRINSYQELKCAEKAFSEIISNLSKTWHLSADKSESLSEIFVNGKKISIVKSLVHYRQYEKLELERDYWISEKYRYSNLKFNVLKWIISNIRINYVTYLLLKILFATSAKRNSKKLVYEDLSKRSTKLESSQ